MKRITLCAALLGLLLLASACAAAVHAPIATAAPSQPPAPTPEPAETGPLEIYVSAAASLTDVMQAIAEQYKAVAPNVKVTLTFGSSGALQMQIEEGAPADLFFPAAQKQMDALDRDGLTAADTRRNLLINNVVLILPANSEAVITSFEDVATDTVNMVAIGDASVPVGQYTEEIFTTLGLWDTVRAKANFGVDVRAVLAWVESGDVDCGVVYATDAATTKGVKIICEAPEGSHQAVIYAAAVLKNAAQPDAARAFLDYLSGPEAAAAFEAAGFTMYRT